MNEGLAVLLVVIALAIGGAVAYAMRLIRVERREGKKAPAHQAGENKPREEEPAGREETVPPEEEGDGLVNLVDLFSGVKEEEDPGEGEPEEGPGGEAADEGGEADPTEKAEEEVAFDRLTGLPVGPGILREARRVLARAEQEDMVYAAACFDVDRFRFINSLKGMSIGDYVLARLGQDMQALFPHSSLFTRLTADHFAVLFPVTGEGVFTEYSDGLRRVCEKIRGDVGIKSGLRISMGIAATGREEGYHPQVLLERANIARHCLKVAPSETYELFQPAMLSTYLYGESALEDYGENQYGEELTLFYAPSADLVKNKIVSSDVLVRWTCEEEALREVPLTVDNGRVRTNGKKILYQACRTMSRWRKAGKEVLPVHVPLQGTELFLRDIDGLLGKCLSEFQLEPHMLRIIVSLSVAAMDWERSGDQLRRLREMGVRAGLEGLDPSVRDLGFLEGYPVSFLRLHRGWMAGGGENMEDIAALAAQAERMHLEACMDGVDSQEQADLLREAGIYLVQGRYSGRPTEGESFLRSLPEFIQRQGLGGGTVILDDESLRNLDPR